MARISDLQSISTPSLTSVFVVSDGSLTRKITLADLKTNIVTQASPETLGTVKVGPGLDISDTGVLSVKNYSAYTLPVASASTLGGVRVGSGLKISDTSILSLDYTLPVASTNTLGGIKVGSHLTMDGDRLSVIFPDFTVFNDSGIVIGNDNDLRLVIDQGYIPTLKEQTNGMLNFSILDAFKTGGTSEFRFISSSFASVLGGDNQPALIPGPDGDLTNLGLPSIKWDKVYGNTFNGDLVGNVTGNSQGIHTGSVLANDNTVAYDATTKIFTGSFDGNITGNANSATQLQVPRLINGVPFDGTQSINITDSTKVPISGTIMSGFLTLHANPSQEFHAATKNYVDGRLASAINVAGGTMAGFLTLNANPLNPLHAATKQYVDSTASEYVELDGSVMRGFLTLNADPVLALHPASKGYTDTSISNATRDLNSGLTSYVDARDATKLSLSGGTMTGFINLHADPTAALHAAPKRYVDNSIAEVASNTDSVLRQYIDARDNTRLPLSGGSMTGFINLHADPTAALHAATKQYVDVKSSGSTAALTNYTDQVAATKFSKSGGALTGFLTLHADPTVDLHASTKRYVDRRISETSLTATYGSSTVAAYYSYNGYFDVFPPAGKTMDNFIAFIPSYGSTQSPYYYYWYWWNYYYNNNQLTWDRLGDRIRVYLNNNYYYYYYYYYYYGINVHWLALWR